MKLELTEHFQRDVAVLERSEQTQLFSVMLKLPTAIKTPQSHSGLGLRKIHPSGIYEARIGLGLRLAFGFESNRLILHRLGSHDVIRRYLNSL